MFLKILQNLQINIFAGVFFLVKFYFFLLQFYFFLKFYYFLLKFYFFLLTTGDVP